MLPITLDMYEKSISKKGIKFIQTPQQVSEEALIHGGKQFHRNIKLAYFFHNKSNNVNDSPKKVCSQIFMGTPW